jgi:DNA polymerase III delta prime subunit
LSVPNVHPIRWNKAAFERLVLPSRTKELVKALVMVRASMTRNSHEVVKSNQTNDIVAGKGKGLIMLFHGSPGTGKTLTAGEQNSTCM